ncbi:MAG: carboxypeptidase regulatory-like domain-containing protein, partial [Bacteroidales bacterium]|nr:carboxypeptidase regulatory-like domain-containing protein [Bacteroidales bacterium]
MKLKSLFTALLLIVLAGYSTFAQQGKGGGQGMNSNLTGIVKGKVFDKTDGIPVEYASVAFYRMRDSTLATGGITNEKGEFTIDKIPMGRYYGEVKFIGYSTTSVEPFFVNPKNLEVSLGNLSLEPASENIETVVITGQKQMLTHNLD